MKKIIVFLALISLLVSACSANTPVPTSAPVLPQAAPTKMATATALPPTASASPLPPSATPEPTLTPTTAPNLFPEVTLSENVVCRKGPDVNYYRVVNYSVGQATEVQGRSADSQWVEVITNAPNKNYTCWLPVTSVKGIPSVADLDVPDVASLPTGARVVTAVRKSVCGVNKANGAVVIDWSPIAEGTGFTVIRNGRNIAQVYGGEYIDHDTPGSKTAYVYTYTIQAFNSVGISKVNASVSVTLCD
jgi:hypothetical protein